MADEEKQVEALSSEEDIKEEDEIIIEEEDDEEESNLNSILPPSLGSRLRDTWRSKMLTNVAAPLTKAQLSPREDEEEENDEEESSSIYSSEATSSMYSTGNKTFQWAASSLVDHVQNYRGRYQQQQHDSTPKEQVPPPPPPPPQPRYLNSTQKEYMQELMDQLEHSHEYILLLGRGMLGVNLKQGYKKSVYVDFLVPHATAHQSGLVAVGDTLVRINDQDLTTETILTVPNLIAQAKRPTHLIMATGALVTPNYIDVAVGFLAKCQPKEEAEEESMMEIPSYKIPPVESVIRPQQPEQEVKDAFAEYVPLRCNQGLFLEVVQLTNPDLRHALQHALVLCVNDVRRLPYLTNDPKLLLFLELWTFQDLYDVTPADKQREVAYKIAYKFFLPTLIQGELVPPMFDFHHIVLDNELRQLEQRLTNHNVDKDIFDAFAKNVIESLQESFLEFLVSDECARMRAYLRHTAPFRNIPLQKVLSLQTCTDQNYMAHVVAYLIGQKDKEVNGEYDHVLEPNGQRVENAAFGVAAALFIRSRLLTAMESVATSDEELIGLFDQFWEQFAAPRIGALDQVAKNSEASDYLIAFRSLLGQLRGYSDNQAELASRLRGDEIRKELIALANELVYDYANTTHAKFKAHKYHEWIMEEMDENEELKSGCLKKLFRKASFPSGISVHKHMHGKEEEQQEKEDVFHGIDCAFAFGSSRKTASEDHEDESEKKDDDIEKVERFGALSFEGSSLTLAQLPPGIETYATVYSDSNTRPHHSFSLDSGRSVDGWGISLINYAVPQADAKAGQDSCIYGVSLVLKPREVSSYSNITVQFKDASEGNAPGTVFYERVESEEDSEDEDEEPSYIMSIAVEGSIDAYNKAMAETKQNSQQSAIGISLVSKANTIPSMRKCLEALVEEYTRLPNDETSFYCNPLASILKTLQAPGLDSSAILLSMLRPLVVKTAASWVDRPPFQQKELYLQEAGDSLIKTLPPVPLALVFISLLLEQKLVLTSSRRSILLSTTTALQELLKPLQWCHLLVPMVPPQLAADLMQYPAPFVLGLPSENPGTMDLIRELPDDVTLVDLDIGRVILAPKLSHHEMKADVRVLRSQVLYLAQSLGNVFGRAMYPSLWNVDGLSSPSVSNPFDSLRETCHATVKELLSGTASCCYWFEEARRSGQPSMEATILFDEDRFLRLKSVEGTYVSRLFTKTTSSSTKISPKDFDLVLKVMLRCQWMNDCIGKLEKTEMLYYT